jgi:hypothetical protein
VEIKTAFLASDKPSKPQNWPWVLGIFLVVGFVALFVRRK